jgi:ABC-type glycerol-3-phosphate transport system permease component
VFFYLALLLLSLSVFCAGEYLLPGKMVSTGTQLSYLYWLGASALVALTVALTGLVLASSIGYVISRSGFLSCSSTLGAALMTQILPGLIVIAGLCVALIQLNLLKVSVIILGIYVVTALPFCIWHLKRTYDAVPLSFDETAHVEGASSWQIFWRFLLPATRGALMITLLFSLVYAWNGILIARLIFPDYTGPSWPPLMNATTSLMEVFLTAIIAILVFLLLSRLLIWRAESVSVVIRDVDTDRREESR